MRLVVGMSGASGAIYGIRVLEVLNRAGVETHLVMSNSARRTAALETDHGVDNILKLATHVHDVDDVGACISSGSFKHDGMVIAPCSIKTLSAVANSFNSNLLCRTADVTLKERRKLILMIRETPLHLGHLRLMTQVTETGAVLVPPISAFYHRPKTLDDMINESVNKALEQFGMEVNVLNRRTGADKPASGQ